MINERSRIWALVIAGALVGALAGDAPGLHSAATAQMPPAEDRVFIVDGSGSISFDDFFYEFDIIQEMLCGPGAPDYRLNPLGIAIVQFGGVVEVVTDYTVIASDADAAVLCAALDQVLPVRGNSLLTPAFLAAEQILEEEGQAATRSVLVMTDAAVNDALIALGAATNLRTMTPPARICAAHITEQCDAGEALLRGIANDPRSNMFVPAQPSGVASCTRLLPLTILGCQNCCTCDTDCNGNGVPDACDITGPVSGDCNGNEIPDECELAGGVEFDCDGDGVLDSCEFAAGSADCDANGVPDECEDCNANGLGDNCETTLIFLDESPTIALAGPVILATYTIVAPPVAAATVSVSVTVSGPLAGMGEFLLLTLNGQSIGIFFDSGGPLCTPLFESMPVPAATFNTLVAGGNAKFDVFGGGIDLQLCVDPSLQIDTTYPTEEGVDVNGNGVLDECDRATGDSNLDGQVNIIDFLAVLATWGPCIEPVTCFTDFDRDGKVGIDDFLNVLAHWGPV